MAFEFDGVDDFVSHGANTTAFTTLSVAVWANVRTIISRASVISKSLSASTDHFSINPRITVDQMWFAIGDEANRGMTPNDTVTAGVWAHWAFVYNGSGVGNAGRLKVWKDGVAQSLTWLGTIPASMTSASANIATGFYQRSGLYLDCVLAHVKMWQAVLTEAELQQEMFSYRPARTANLFPLWSPYDDSVAADYSGNDNHGAITGALAADGPFVGGGVPVRRF